MQFLTTALLALGAVAAAAPATDAAAAQKSYYLKTSLLAGQTGKAAYNNLYLTAYHSGAGFNDAVLVPGKKNASPGQLVKVNTTASGVPVYDQIFKLGEYNYSLIVEANEDFYAAWQPTAINIGVGGSQGTSFFLNSTGLQWTTDVGSKKDNGEFDGWLVCDWFRSVPQLFFLVVGEDGGAKIPSTCAKVNLVPEYI